MPITGDSMRLRIQRGESLRSYVARTLYLNFGKHELSSLANGNILTKDVRKIASILGWSGCHGFNRLLHEHTNYPMNSVFKDDHDISYSLASYTNSRYVIESSALSHSFCPDCLSDDIKSLGYSYWRRPLHSDVNVCTKHSTKLVHNCPFCGEHFSVDNHGLEVMWSGCNGRYLNEVVADTGVDEVDAKLASFVVGFYQCSFHIPIEKAICVLIERLIQLRSTTSERIDQLESDLEWLDKRIHSMSCAKSQNNGLMVNVLSFSYFDMVIVYFDSFDHFLNSLRAASASFRPIDSLWHTYNSGGFESLQFVQEDEAHGMGYWSCPYPFKDFAESETLDSLARRKKARYACCDFPAPKKLLVYSDV